MCACVFEWDPAFASKGVKCYSSSFLDFVPVGKTLIGLPRGPAGPSPACGPAERRPSQGGQGRSGGSALAVNPPPRRPLRLNRFSAQAGSEAAVAAAKQLNGFEPIRLWKTLSINSSECARWGRCWGCGGKGARWGPPVGRCPWSLRFAAMCRLYCPLLPSLQQEAAACMALVPAPRTPRLFVILNGAVHSGYWSASRRACLRHMGERRQRRLQYPECPAGVD